jgi:integrase
LQPWVLHDLRRTAVTMMAEIGVPPHVVEAVVNHVSGHKSGVAGIYNRATYASEKRAALQRWADQLDSFSANRLAKTPRVECPTVASST